MPIFLFMTSPLLYQISSNISENRYTINSMHLGWRKFPSPNSDLHSILPMTYAALWGSLNRERGREWFLILKKMKVLEMVIKFIGNEDKFREMLQWKHESSQISKIMMKERREEGRKKTGRVKKRKNCRVWKRHFRTWETYEPKRKQNIPQMAMSLALPHGILFL